MRIHATRNLAAASVLAVILGVLLPSAASAAPTTLALAGPVTAGNPVVTFKGTVNNPLPGDVLYLCFGDNVACTATNGATAGTLVSQADITGPGISHTYAVGNYSARLYDVTAGASPKTTTSPALAVRIGPNDATAVVTATTAGLTATLNGSKSTATAGDTWWACFGENGTCAAGSPDASGTVAAPGGVPSSIPHMYSQPGTYSTSLTVVGHFLTSVAAVPVAVTYAAPYAILTADQTSGTGNLPVIFNGSTSVTTATGPWAFCFGDVVACSRTSPDLAGTGTVALPSTAHNYAAGNYTATLWVRKGTATSTATVGITVANSVAAPDGTCSISGVIRTCDLFAKSTGSVKVGDSIIPFWGFTTSDGASPVLGGPKLVATVGEKLAFTVHNQLPGKAGNVAVTVPALIGAPDLAGVAPGATGPSGSFTLTTPGTYIYEAGLTSGGERQVAMGMSGLLIVRPSVLNSADSAHCAYSSAVASADCITGGKEPGNYFDREKIVVVTELDDKYNSDPFANDTGEYNPTHFFLDGVAYDPAKTALDPSDPAFDPAVDDVRFDGAPGDTVLLRYADLGLREHSLNLTNLLQNETAKDAHLLPGSHVQDTEFLNAGQTADSFVTIPADAVTGTTFPLSDAGFHLNNGEAPGLGGMYAELDVVGGATAADVGPVGSAADANTTFDPAAPNLDNGQVPAVTVTATFTANALSTTVKSVGWYLDGVPAPSLWQDSGYAPAAPGSASPTVSFTIAPATLRALLGNEPGRVFGDHTIWLQATDSNGKPGPAIGAVFTLAMRNAVISALSISPQVTNGATRPSQLPNASTQITVLSDGQELPQSTLNVASTKGFPATCNRPGLPSPTDNGCLLTVGMSIAGGPSAGSIVYSTFTYTGLTDTSFTGIVPSTDIPPNAYQLSTGSTVVLDDVPAGYIALNGTATASLPGFVVGAAQACVLSGSSAPPAPTDAVDTKCDPAATGGAQTIYDLNLDSPAALAPVNGFLPAPVLPTGVNDAAKFWVMVRAQELPSGESCVTSPTDCRWSPWVYYNPGPGGPIADPSTYETLSLVTTGPTTGAVAVTPNPNNGFDAAAGNLGLFDAFNVTATATSPWANIALAEVFLAPTSRSAAAAEPLSPTECISTGVPAGCVVFGQGAEMAPAGGFWNNGLTKTATAFLPLSELQGMPDGVLRVWVHAKDIAGNWGPMQWADLTLDRTTPTIDSVVSAAAGGALTTAVAVTAHDGAANGVSAGVVSAEWFTGSDPGPGNGKTAVTTPSPIAAPSVIGGPTSFTIGGLPAGRTINIRVLDAAGNWSLTASVKT